MTARFPFGRRVAVGEHLPTAAELNEVLAERDELAEQLVAARGRLDEAVTRDEVLYLPADAEVRRWALEAAVRTHRGRRDPAEVCLDAQVFELYLRTGSLSGFDMVEPRDDALAVAEAAGVVPSSPSATAAALAEAYEVGDPRREALAYMAAALPGAEGLDRFRPTGLDPEARLAFDGDVDHDAPAEDDDEPLDFVTARRDE